MRDELGREKADEGGRGWRRVWRSVIGAPDYESYLEHCRTAGHPPRMTEREFVAAFFESKGKGVRCC
jgi:uncharacterized short protein YbdD (DUF466 family)